MLSYSTGGFTAMYATGKLKNSATTTWTTNGEIGGATAVTDTLALGTTQSASAMTGTYDFGMAKLFVGSSSAKSGNDADQKASSYIYGVSVPFGAASFGISSSNASYTSAAAVTTKETGLRIMAKYALSKRTTAYLQNGTSKVTGTTRATAQTGLGLTHNF
jgi:predicted porin